MKSQSLRTLALLLCGTAVLPLLVSCGGVKEEVSNASATTAETQAAETEPARQKDSVPDGFTFGGRTITFFTRDGLRKSDVDGGGELSGDLVEDAVYARNQTVEDRLNVKISVISDPGNWKDAGAVMESSILAGDDAWQVVFTSGNSAIQSSRDYLFQDVSALKYINRLVQ